jgi:signal transduction histidine kinase
VSLDLKTTWPMSPDQMGMNVSMATETSEAYHSRLLETMERILAIDALDLSSAMNAATQLIAEAFGADKVDAMFLEHETQTLVALGTSDTPMGHRQHALGLQRLPLANGGRAARVFETGVSFRSGRMDEDPEELPGLVHGLGIRSEIIAPVDVDGTRRGVVLASSAAHDAFSEADLRFLDLIGRWLGMVAHRSALNEQLQQQSAERGRRVAGEELITVLAHDVRNLLTPLVARIGLLRRRADRDGRERDVQDLDVASRSVRRLTQLMENLLDVARLESGAFAITPRPVELVSLVEETVSAYQTTNRSIRIQAPDDVEACLDPESIRQVLENLLSNAVKHSPEHTPVHVRLRVEPRGDDEWAIVTVSNEGQGVPPELLPRLFTRFAADSRSTGVGLGLYIASKVVALHGGTITVDSSPGQGAHFHVALPLAGPSPETAL